MKAVVVEKYGPIDQLVAREVPDPAQPTGRDLLVRVHAVSVNPIDIKMRAGRYDDYSDDTHIQILKYNSDPGAYHILGYDGAGEVVAVGPDATLFSPGDQVYYSGSPTRNGSNSELQLVNERSVGHIPKALDFVQAASMPLTYITAYEALVERLEIKKGEDAGLLIINGAGGVGAVATQIARVVLGLKTVVTTASRPETVAFSKEMGATHVVNHREDVVKQVKALNLDVPIKYIFITHSTDMYMSTCAEICAPFGKVCSIVQGQAKMYGTPFMAKSLTYVWCLIGTKPFYDIDVESHHRILEDLAGLVDEGKIKSHLRKRMRLTADGLRKAHEIIESGGSIGKVGLGVDEPGEGTAFA